MSDPFLITGPALLSFSGGRTSAYMLWRILQAHGGTLPDDVHVVFFNTGKERFETLRFVDECATNWNVPVRWLEYRNSERGFEETTFATCSKSGEPFMELIRKKGYLPNRGAGYCSIELKGRVGRDFCRKELGWAKRWNSVIGLRADEMDRVWSAKARTDKKGDPWDCVMPLYHAGVTRRDVKAFWAAQPFDLGLLDYEGNCDLCWKKSRNKLKRVIRDNPLRALWWTNAEKGVSQEQTGRQFNAEFRFADLVREVREQPMLPINDDVDQDHDVECGLMCPGDEEALATTPQGRAA